MSLQATSIQDGKRPTLVVFQLEAPPRLARLSRAPEGQRQLSPVESEWVVKNKAAHWAASPHSTQLRR